jgi:hypothetical protein
MGKNELTNKEINPINSQELLVCSKEIKMGKTKIKQNKIK